MTRSSGSRKARRAGAVEQMRVVKQVLGVLVVVGEASTGSFSDANRKRLAEAARKDLARVFGLRFASAEVTTADDIVMAGCTCGRTWTQAQLDAGENPDDHACDVRAESAVSR